MRLILLLLLLSACEPAETLVRPFVQDDPSRLPYRIHTRTYPDYLNGRPVQYTAYYRYQPDGRLSRIDSAWRDRNMLYEYDNGRLVRRLTQLTRNDSLVFRETFEYGPEGRLARRFWTDHSTRIQYDYQYDAAGQLTEVRYRALTYAYEGSTRYSWRNGNIVASVGYDAGGQKQSEWSYEYDQHPNVNGLVRFDPDDPFQFTSNNVILRRLDRDYTGLIDLAVNPLQHKLRYNGDQLVERIETNMGTWLTYTYERK